MLTKQLPNICTNYSIDFITTLYDKRRLGKNLTRNDLLNLKRMLDIGLYVKEIFAFIEIERKKTNNEFTITSLLSV